MRYKEPTPAELAAFQEWLAQRPPNIRAVAERFDPWSLYRMRPNGERVTVASFSEGDDGRVTLTVGVTGEFNLVPFDKSVFGVSPDNLEPCDLPPKGTVLGVLLDDPDDKQRYIDMERLKRRPDLWFRDTDGQVKWKGPPRANEADDG